ncbi:hypothetical protein EDB85DRAFT_2295083 [Lactarius pseudohatsudake]|nr:hypothetical protein EDB85DRAFT_2295083 [Lactarius pseudohatsudake]
MAVSEPKIFSIKPSHSGRFHDLNTSAPIFYVRHNPTISYNSVTLVPSRLVLHRDFDDLVADVTSRSGCLGSLGRGDTNKTLSNVYSFVSNATGYTNLDIALADIPLTNTTGIIPGPLNVQYYVPITAPNTSAVGAGGGAVFVASGVDTSFTAASVPAPVNLTAQGKTVPWLGPRVAASSSNTSASGSGNGAAGAREGIIGATVLGALLAGVVTLLLA